MVADKGSLQLKFDFAFESLILAWVVAIRQADKRILLC